MKMLSVNLFSISLVVISFTSLAATQTSRTPVGYVLEIQGEWYLLGNSGALKRWQKLPPGGTISIKTRTPDARIVIARLSGEIIDSRNCETGECSRPIKLPGNNTGRSLLGVVFNATTEFLLGSPDRYSLNRQRTFKVAIEGVVRLDGGKIDFSPVLKQTGRYYVRWRARPRSGRAGEWSSPVGLKTELGQPALVAVSDFKPGLYEINLQNFTAGAYETFASAWVLVSTSPKYESAAASFQQAVELTEQWGTTVEPDTPRRFLRAHLDYLAEQAGKSKMP
jgi:hypothetical protein